jgi:hypothetical protein
MSKRLWLVVGLAVVVAGLSGCSFFGPNCGPRQKCVERSSALHGADMGVGLATPDQRCMPFRCTPLMAEYGQQINRHQDFFATYFFNYDRNDPYRGNDFKELGEVTGSTFLSYDKCKMRPSPAGYCDPCGGPQCDPCACPTCSCGKVYSPVNCRTGSGCR